MPERVIARRRRVGQRIRTAREMANLTQERLAELVDVDRRTIVNVELGYTSPRLDTLLMIADAVRTPLSELVREGAGE
ncbi:helix-turn-helix transcriptional regulator [Actinacidiphila rubida]|uniref:helix-turn-helix transcriptional regulator n=1 Tax=Actinacidiphila rubida TaxID=310780 RepID=UPI001FE980AD|nr:helix-turn-helix transcriptional regulator [Actinacidiphila rubida]